MGGTRILWKSVQNNFFEKNKLSGNGGIILVEMSNQYEDADIDVVYEKKYFLNEKFPGVTEYLAYEFKIKKYAMLIYNKKLSVAPITTHMPIRNISQKLSKKLIIDRAVLINNFYIKYIKKKLFKEINST